MATGTVRISDSTRKALRDLADREQLPMQTILDRAIESYRRRRFLDALNQTFAELSEDRSTLKDEQDERDDWDNATADDIG
jgi:predicted transcriptional regulator